MKVEVEEARLDLISLQGQLFLPNVFCILLRMHPARSKPIFLSLTRVPRSWTVLKGSRGASWVRNAKKDAKYYVYRFQSKVSTLAKGGKQQIFCLMAYSLTLAVCQGCFWTLNSQQCLVL